MDGTLSDTSKVSSVALRQYVPEFGLKNLTDEKIKKPSVMQIRSSTFIFIRKKTEIS